MDVPKLARRSFLGAFSAAIGGLLLPEPRRVYSFARELRVPGIEETVLGSSRMEGSPGWHRLSITWDGKVGRGYIDGVLAVEQNCPPKDGIFFEYDPAVPGYWRAASGKASPMPTEETRLVMQRGHILLDYLCEKRCREDRTLEALVLVRPSSAGAAVKLGWHPDSVVGWRS